MFAGNECLINEFTSLVGSKGVALGAESFRHVQTIGLVAEAKGITNALLGQIRRERDGLLSFRDIARQFTTKRMVGCFAGNKFILMAHKYYRRGMNPICNWEPGFLNMFWRLDGDKIEKYIALDEDRVRIDVDAPDFHEKDFWYGAPYVGNMRNIQPGVVKLCPPLDIDEPFASDLFADAYCLDIDWSESSGVKCFQSLEMKKENIRVKLVGKSYFPARYMHAEFDSTANCIQLFTENKYLQRRESDFRMWKKNCAHIKPKSTKIFKINGL